MMKTINRNTLLSLAAISICFAIPASATTVTITAGPFTSVAGATTATFDSGVLPPNFTASGPSAGVVTGSVTNQYAAPLGDTTAYAYAGPGSSLTETFATPVSYFGLYWGSPDTYNTLSFTDTNGVTTVWGEGGTPVPGLVTNQTTPAYVNFWDSGVAWKSVTWTSSVAAFEFDNAASGSPTPEPASVGLLAGGLLAIGVGVIRRRKNA
jgi:hypothetical protein